MAGHQNGHDSMSEFESDDNDNGSDLAIGIRSGISPPLIHGMVRIASSTHIIPPDSEENVEAQTGDIFLNYVYQSYRLESSSSDTLPTDLLNFNNVPRTPAAEIGRQLATIGDDITRRYSFELDDMISSVFDVDAYDAFANIARRVFRSGIRWHRILVLLNFGYRLAIAKWRHSAADFSSFLSRIISFIVKFIVSERIARWIAQRGGWRGALSITQGTSTPVFLLVSAMAALSVLTVIAVRKFL